jgi:hypothetical protein
MSTVQQFWFNILSFFFFTHDFGYVLIVRHFIVNNIINASGNISFNKKNWRGMSIWGEYNGTTFRNHRCDRYGGRKGEGRVSFASIYVYFVYMKSLQRFLYYLSVRRLCGVDNSWMMNWRGFLWSNRCTIPALAWWDWGKPQTLSGNTHSLR